MKKVITIEGMRCAHCTGSVEKALRNLPGVRDVQMDLASKSATLEVDDNVSNDVLSNAITKSGYSVTGIE